MRNAFAVSIEPLWRATIIFRIVAWGFAAVIVWANIDGYQRRDLAWAALGAMAVWTIITSFSYARPRWRRAWVAIADLALTSALQYTSVYILSPAQLHSSFPTITTVWTVGPAIVCGAMAGRLGGLAAGAILSVVNVVTRGFFDADMGRDAVLLLGLGFLIGQVAVTTQRAEERLRLASQLEAAAAERERLARSIHDGVLQVLARVSRRGAELGGEDAELGRLAAEQEHALRALVAAGPGESPDGLTDLCMLLTLRASPRVHVSVPASAVLLAAHAASEISAVVGEALSNADRHAGPGAQVWVLVEDLGEEVAVSVRDDGPGIPEGRLAAAIEQGRMGVAKSMRGRVLDLGGTIELKTQPGMGTEWEIRLPRPE